MKAALLEAPHKMTVILMRPKKAEQVGREKRLRLLIGKKK
jgi:hypothetical protein